MFGIHCSMNRHIIKNIVYSIAIAVITLISVSIIIDNCEKNTEGNLETIFRNDQPFHELEVCVNSKNIIVTSCNIYALILIGIGIMQIFHAFFYTQDPKEKKLLATAGQLIVIISIIGIIVLRSKVSSGM